MKSEGLSEKELRTFGEQIRLSGVGQAGQLKIRKSRILVIGAGGKGTSALRCLVCAGVGMLGISDNYVVEQTALPRQNLYGEDDLGRHKAIITKQKLTKLSGLTSFEIHNICLTDQNILPILSPYELVIDATDNFPAHYLINDAAIRCGRPVVFGSVVHNTALVTVFNHAGGPSLRCLYPAPPKNREEYNDSGITAINHLLGITGTMMANEALKIVLGTESVLNGKLLKFRMGDYTATFTPIRRNPANFPS
jgi:adenylyltransferase/sulfurtransferase